MYLFGETWYKLLPNPVESIAPTIVKPLTKVTWKYTNPLSLATSGIYSQSDLDKLRDHIMFTAKKPMILNSLAREITRHITINQGISLTNLFNEDVIDKIAESGWGRFWTIFTSFGTTSSGLIGLIIIIRGKSTTMEHYYDEPNHVPSNQKKKYRTDSMGFLNHVEILRNFTIKYGLPLP